MNRTVCAIEPETTIERAAALMHEFDVGALPVLNGHHVVGMVTDRDLAIRALARALPAGSPVSAVMTSGAHACASGEDIADVLLDMETLQLRRMPVENSNDEFIGMLSLSDLFAGCTDEEIGRALRRICRKKGQGLEMAA